MRATTRSYAEVMKNAPQGSLFPHRMQEVVERHLEFRMDFPQFSDVFDRYGAKGGSLFPAGVLNWAVFMQNRANGDQVVVSIQLRRVGGGFGFLPAFAEAIALDPAFAQFVRDSLPADPELPELSLFLTDVDTDPRGKGRSLDVSVQLATRAPSRCTRNRRYACTCPTTTCSTPATSWRPTARGRFGSRAAAGPQHRS